MLVRVRVLLTPAMRRVIARRMQELLDDVYGMAVNFNFVGV